MVNILTLHKHNRTRILWCREEGLPRNIRAFEMENDNRVNTGKYKKLIEYLKTLQDRKFTGYIRINYTQGNVGRIEKFEEVLKK